MKNLVRLLAFVGFSIACLTHISLLIGKHAFESNSFYTLFALGIVSIGIATTLVSVHGGSQSPSMATSLLSLPKQKILVGLFGYILLVLVGNEPLHDRYSPEIQNGTYVLVHKQKGKPPVFISEITKTEYVKRMRAKQLMATAIGATMLFGMFAVLSTDE